MTHVSRHIPPEQRARHCSTNYGHICASAKAGVFLYGTLKYAISTGQLNVVNGDVFSSGTAANNNVFKIKFIVKLHRSAPNRCIIENCEHFR